MINFNNVKQWARRSQSIIEKKRVQRRTSQLRQVINYESFFKGYQFDAKNMGRDSTVCKCVNDFAAFSNPLILGKRNPKKILNSRIFLFAQMRELTLFELFFQGQIDMPIVVFIFLSNFNAKYFPINCHRPTFQGSNFEF